MAIVKLVCQGCGANLDAKDDQRVFLCGYCGTSNQIKQTVQHSAPSPPPPPPVQPNVYAQQVSYQAQRQAEQAQRAGSAIKWIVLAGVLLPLVLGGFITFMVFRTTSEVFERVGLSVNGGANRGLMGRRYRWASPRPFVADLDGDGSDDIVGAIVEAGSQQLLLTAMSGADWSTLWEVELGQLADLPNPAFHFEPESKLVLMQLGATLHAYDGQSGAQRWIASLPDKAEAIGLDGEQLWVRTIDEAGHHVSLADGKLSPAQDQAPAQAQALLDGEGYELIPSLRELDLKSNQYPDTRVDKAFCPKQDLAFGVGRGARKAPRCANPHGLAFVTRDKGTAVPFLLGYERESKAERWRVQLTKAGTLETVDSGFGQPRAELFGDDAIVSFVPAKQDDAMIRRISLLDGATRWETQLTRGLTENVDAMVVGERFVFVTYGQRIIVLKLDDGSQVAELGGL